jgi:NAD(P)-dependent dehydrogenase (short-subunit alcohol dehydrogenase family)
MPAFVNYTGKRVLVTGCFSGMGEATARLLLELGAEVHGLDYKDSALPLAGFSRVDLRDADAIDAAASNLKGSFDALFNCAGVSGAFSPTDIFKVNFLGLRRLTNHLVPRLAKGGAISCIASTAGFNWMQRIPLLKELLKTTSDADGLKWCESLLNPRTDAYTLSKEAIILWVLKSSTELMRRGLRINCILPGPTETPFMTAQSKITPDAMIDIFTQPINRRSRPEEQAAALAFLNSEAASYISGVALPVDGGFMGGVISGELDLAAMFGALSAKR